LITFQFYNLLKSKLSNLKNNEKYILFILFLLGFITRLAFGIILYYQTGDTYPIASCDGDTYFRYGLLVSKNFSNIYNGNVDPSILYGVGYWGLFIGLIFKVFNNSIIAVIIIQSLIGAFIPLFIYNIARYFFNFNIALLSSIISILQQGLIEASGALYVEALFIPLFLGALYFFINFIKDYTNNNNFDIKKIIFSGLLYSIAYIVRPIIAPLPFVFIIILFFINSFNLKYKLKFLLYFSISASPILLLYWIRNYNISHKLILLSGELSAGYNAFSPLAKIGFDPINHPIESLKFIFSNPWTFINNLSFIFHRTLEFFFLGNFGNFDPLYLTNPSRYNTSISSFIELLSFIFISIGIIFLIRNYKKYKMFLLLITFIILNFYIGPTIFHFVRNARYRWPITPFTSIIAAIGIYFYLIHTIKEYKNYL